MGVQQLVLLVEDNDDDAFFFNKARASAAPDVQAVHVRNGQDAIDYLNGAGAFTDRARHPLPHLILLDLQMPICNGFEFLAWKREQIGLTAIPTVVMSSSTLETDIRRSYELGAHSFTSKLLSIDLLAQRITSLRNWWFEHCITLPA